MSTQKYFNPINQRNVTFEALAITIKGRKNELSGYKIYQDATHYKLIQAQTVAQAIVKSGIAQPHKIIQTGIKTHNIFNQDELNELEERYNRVIKKPSTTLPPPIITKIADML